MKTTLFGLLASLCVLASAWCGWKAWQESSNVYGVSVLILFACATVAAKIGTVPDPRFRRKWFVITPGMTTESGPYDIQTLGKMWKRGLMPPGTQVAESGHEWMDVAAMVKVLDSTSEDMGASGIFGSLLIMVGLMVFFFWSWLAGAILMALGLLFIIAAKVGS